jgi:hypothetical protein
MHYRSLAVPNREYPIEDAPSSSAAGICAADVGTDERAPKVVKAGDGLMDKPRTGG